MSDPEIRKALELMGFATERVAWHPVREGRPTVSRWLRERTKKQVRDQCLISAGRHFVVVQGRRFVDNRFMERGSLRQAHRRRVRVHAVWKITIQQPSTLVA